MKHDETNINVLKQLQEYAQLYFVAIVELHTVDGVCSLKPGKYSASELTDNSYKSALGSAWALPRDTMFDEVLTVEAGAFQCSFCYRDIFKVLAKWEGMAGAGKQKAVFEVGNVDEKSAKVLLKETTELGRYKEKRIRVQRVAGNWWAPRRIKRNESQIPLYYELNGVMFMPGREVYGEDDLHSDSTTEWCERHDDAKMTEQLLKTIDDSGDAGGYLQEVAKRAGVTEPQTEEAVQPQVEEAARQPHTDETSTAIMQEPKQPEINTDGTIRTKVLQYKADGNTLTEKWETLTKHSDGIYYSYTNVDKYGDRSIKIIFAKNGVYWRHVGVPDHWFNPESHKYAENMAELKAMYDNYEADILQAAANGGCLNKLHITVMERLGHDVAPLLAAYEERKRKRKEIGRIRAEEEARREQERQDAENRRKAELLADCKEKLLAHESITVEQIELIAEAVGYTIHGRTLGFMRKRVVNAAMLEDGSVRVYGYSLTSLNGSGTANVIKELYARIKQQAEVTELQPSTVTEMPQIPTTEPQTTNVSAEGEKREIITTNCLYWDYPTQSIKEGAYELIKVTEHLYYIDNGGQFVTIARCLNGVYWVQQGNAEIHRSAFDSTRPEYTNILKQSNAYQTAGDFIAYYQHRAEQGWSSNAFYDEIFNRITAAALQAHTEPQTVNCTTKGEKREKTALQSTQTAPTAKYTTAPPKRCQRPRKQPKTAMRSYRHHIRSKIIRIATPRSIILPPPGIWAAANSPPRHPTLTSAAKHKQPQ